MKVEPAEFVVTITIPESVSTDPSELVVVHVVVKDVNPLSGNSEVVV